MAIVLLLRGDPSGRMLWSPALICGRIVVDRPPASTRAPGRAAAPRPEFSAVTTSDPKSVADPQKNPSYPQRVHLSEKPLWLETLRKTEKVVADHAQKLNLLGNNPQRTQFERLHAQMLGARDQVADAVKRLPLETGGLYEEDKHRVEYAEAALNRLVDQWAKLPAR